jgi:hypothetical protein
MLIYVEISLICGFKQVLNVFMIILHCAKLLTLFFIVTPFGSTLSSLKEMIMMLYERLPNASRDEIAAGDGVCIICRMEMSNAKKVLF